MIRCVIGLMIILLLLTVGFAGNAQNIHAVRAYHIIEEVTLEHHEGEWALRITGFQPDGCELPVEVEQYLEEDDRWLMVEVYREVPVTMICVQILVPYDEVVSLDDDIATWLDDYLDSPYVDARNRATPQTPVDVTLESLLIEVNDFIGRIDFGGDADPNDLSIEQVERVPMVVEEVEADLSDGVALLIKGYHPDGCREPYRSQVRIVDDEVYVQVYRAERESVVCPAILRAFAAMVEIEDVEPGRDYTYHVNGIEGEFTVEGDPMAQGEDASRTLHVVEAVDVQVTKSDPSQVILNVSGYIPDGCRTETLIDIRQRGNVIDVTIYRELPPFVMCPMMIVPYADTIPLQIDEPGIYRVRVNGVETILTIP